MPVCSRKGCSAEASIVIGKGDRQSPLHYCVPCYRMHLMRRAAKAKGKVVPSIAEILAMVPADMKCPCCREAMHWHGQPPRAHQITLQHWRADSMGLICLRCNTRERNYPDDELIFCMPEGYKRCPGCGDVLPFRSFGIGAHGYPLGFCRPCSRKRAKDYVRANQADVKARRVAYYWANVDLLRAKARAYQQQRRLARGASGPSTQSLGNPS